MTNKFTLTIVAFFILLANLCAQDCEEFEVAGETCQLAPYICDLEGYCSNNYTAVGNGTPNAFCGQVENDVWLAFRAGTTNLVLEIEPYECQNNNGIQAAIFTTTDCDNFTLASNCFDAGSPQIFILSTNNLIIGNTYHIIIDGKGGDRCNFTFNLLEGNTIAPDWAIAGAPITVCPEEENVVLEGSSLNNSSNAEYSWFTDDGNIIAGQNTLNPTVNSAGTYALVVTDVAQSCTDTSFTTVDFFSEIEINIPSAPFLDCENNITVDINVIASGGNENFSFVWQNEMGELISELETATVSEPGIYQATVTFLATGCTKSGEVEVFADLNTPIIEIDMPDELNCLVDSIPISAANSSQNPSFIINWASPNGTIISGNNSLFPVVTSAAWYYLEIENPDNGCLKLDSVEVIRNELEPEDIFATIRQPCFGEETGTLQIDSVLSGNPEYLFSFDSAAFAAVTFYENLPPNTYTISVKDEIGCTFEKEFQIIPQDEILLDLGNDFEIHLGDSLPLEVLISTDSLSFEWLNSNPYLSCYDCSDPIVNPLETDYYQLKVTDKNGCMASDTLTIYVDERRRIYMATAFSPNNDGINDLLFINGGNDVEKVISYRIFDRWGNMYHEEENFEINDPTFGFDGTHRGKPLNPSALVWTAEILFIDGATKWYSGVTMLVR